MVARTLVTGLSHLLRLFRIGHDAVDSVGHVMHELVWIGRSAGAVVQLVDRHEISGFAIDDDFGNAAGRGGHHRKATRHGLQVHDTEWLVDGWADERVATVLKRVELRLRQHLLNPDDVAALLVKLGERGFDLVHDLRSVGRARA